MDLKKTLSDISSRNMSRREFLASAGAAVLAIVGISTFLRAFDHSTNRQQSQGYGSSAYGGGESSARTGNAAAQATRPRV
jgi:uncharacterized membrane protein